MSGGEHIALRMIQYIYGSMLVCVVVYPLLDSPIEMNVFALVHAVLHVAILVHLHNNEIFVGYLVGASHDPFKRLL